MGLSVLQAQNINKGFQMGIANRVKDTNDNSVVIDTGLTPVILNKEGEEHYKEGSEVVSMLFLGVGTDSATYKEDKMTKVEEFPTVIGAEIIDTEEGESVLSGRLVSIKAKGAEFASAVGWSAGDFIEVTKTICAKFDTYSKVIGGIERQMPYKAHRFKVLYLPVRTMREDKDGIAILVELGKFAETYIEFAHTALKNTQGATDRNIQIRVEGIQSTARGLAEIAGLKVKSLPAPAPVVTTESEVIAFEPDSN